MQPLPSEKLISNANECLSEGRLEDGIRLYERAIQLGFGMPDAYREVAKAYEQQNEAAHATWHLKCFAACKVEAGDVDNAVDVLEHCVRLVPTDLEAWERLVHALMMQSAPKLDPHAVGKDLIDLYLELDEVERSRNLLEDLLKQRPNDIELKKTLIAVNNRAGDTKRVMELYESIADDLVQQKDPIGAVRYLQKILMIDRNRREISDRIKQLYVMDERTRSRRRSMAIFVALLLTFGAVGTIYYMYERNVRKVFGQLDAETFIQQKDYEGAIAMYQDFLKRYPLSFIDSDVQWEIDRINALADEHREELERARNEKAAEAAKVRKSYLAKWRAYRSAAGARIDMRLALKQLEEIHRMAMVAGEPADKQFLADNDIEKAIRTTRDYLTEASQLARKVEEAFARGDVESARRGRGSACIVSIHLYAVGRDLPRSGRDQEPARGRDVDCRRQTVHR